MIELVINTHSIEKAKERISILRYSSKEIIKNWLGDNVPRAKKILLGSELYNGLERVYNRREYRPIVYKMDSFGIYIIELLGWNKELLSVQDLSFKGKMKIKLTDDSKTFLQLIELRESLSV